MLRRGPHNATSRFSSGTYDDSGSLQSASAGGVSFDSPTGGRGGGSAGARGGARGGGRGAYNTPTGGGPGVSAGTGAPPPMLGRDRRQGARGPPSFDRGSPLTLVGRGVAMLGAAPSTPTNSAGRPPGESDGDVNADGSFSVVRDDEEANNSGLLDLQPFFGPRGVPLRRTQRSPLAKSTKGANAKGKRKASDSFGVATFDQGADGSIIIHPDPDDEVENEDDEQPGMSEPFPHLEVEGKHQVLALRLRRCLHDAMKHHLYTAAIFYGEQLLELEATEQRFNDAYFLAQALFSTHQYARAEQLLLRPLRPGAAYLEAAERGASGSAAPPANDNVGDVDGDALAAALSASRARSILPASILARTSKGPLRGSHLHHADTDIVEMDEEGDVVGEGDEIGEQSATRESARRKRKERGFTVSGTGTASSSGGMSAAGSEQGDKLGGEDEAMEAEPAPDADGEDVKPRVGPTASAKRSWQTERTAALREIRGSVIDPPDGENLVNFSQPCRLLAAHCQVRQGKIYEALDLIGEDNSGWRGGDEASTQRPSYDGGIKLVSSASHLRGQIYMRLDDVPRARDAFMAALALDVKNYEAFAAIVEGNLLGADEQWAFVEALPWAAQAGDDADEMEALEFLRLTYLARLNKTSSAHATASADARRRLVTHWNLSSSPEVLLSLADDLYARQRYADVHTVTSRIMELAADHSGAMPLHIGAMFHLPRLHPTLFVLAHRLTDKDPEDPCAWYAVGVWYSASGRWTEARRYFSKASLLDPRFAAAWIAFAHSFAHQSEADQAITSYSTAARKFPWSPLPQLFIGMEHLQQGNLSLASVFLEGSARMYGGRDALCSNELGVVSYLMGDLDKAVMHFTKALKEAAEAQQPRSRWRDTHLNLAHAYRRKGRGKDATKEYLAVVDMDPNCVAAYVGLGMTAHRAGDLADAVGWYHEALAIQPRDPFATELLDAALDEQVASSLSDRLNIGLSLEQGLDDGSEGGQTPRDGEADRELEDAKSDISIGPPASQSQFSSSEPCSPTRASVSAGNETSEVAIGDASSSSMMQSTGADDYALQRTGAVSTDVSTSGSEMMVEDSMS